jgi:hypothetical protein
LIKITLLIILSFSPAFVQAQTDIAFQYDEAGNQTVRELCLGGCFSAKKTKSQLKDTDNLLDEDFAKFSSDDIFSYYPNPVLETLFIKWSSEDYKSIADIQLYNINGQQLQNFSVLKNTSLSINFTSYAKGVYLIRLIHNDGEQKTIKIIKQ